MRPDALTPPRIFSPLNYLRNFLKTISVALNFCMLYVIRLIYLPKFLILGYLSVRYHNTIRDIAFMKKNIGIRDRAIRLAIGCVCLIYAWQQRSWIALACALLIFYEAIAGWCLLYHLLGKSSCQINHDNQK